MKTVTRKVIFRKTVAFLLVIKASIGFGAPAVCTTAACRSRGAELLANMNTSVNPCDNFYQFACGQWISKHSVPSYASMHGQFHELDHTTKYKMSDILAMSFDSKNPVEEVLFKAHTACMLGSAEDESRDDRDAWNEIMANLGVQEWPNGAGDVVIPLWSRLLGSMIVNFNHRPIVDVDVKMHPNLTSYMIHMKPGGLATNSKHFDSIEYQQYITHVAKALGVTSLNREQLNYTVQQMVAFEKRLAEILSEPSTNEDSLMHVSDFGTDDEMRRSQVNVYQVLDNTFVNANVTVRRDDLLLVTEKPKVRKLLMACGEWEKQIVSNVLVWNLLQTVGMEVMPGLRALRDKFKSQIRGKKHTGGLPQTLHCGGVLARLAPAAYSKFFVDHFFNDSVALIPTVSDMVEFQGNVFRGELVANDWMDEETRNAAIEKLKYMEIVVGFPWTILDNGWLQQQVPTLQDVKGERFVNFYVAFARITRARKLLLLRSPPGPQEDIFDATVVNAYYHRKKNKVFIPAGILRRPFFDPDLPGYLNHASLGYIVFHEIAHGFDSNGRHYDALGKLRDWWTAKTAEVFLKKSQCFVDQYGSITDPDSKFKLNSTLTLGEDIADNAAARQSYLAFQAMEREKENLEVLPGLEAYTPAQLHFIMAAQPWCKKYSPDSKKFVIQDDVHTISEYRVNVAMGNTPAFSNSFKCPPGSKMNFANRCKVW